MSKLTPLPAECAAAIAAKQPFASHAEAVKAINHGIRGVYLRRMYAVASAENASDRLVHDTGAAINLACDRAVALSLTAIGSNAVDCLTEAERAAIGS